MAGVWLFAENREHALELLNIGRILADKLGGPLTALLCQDPGQARDTIEHGADEVLLLPPLAEDQTLEAYLPVMAGEARQGDPDLILVAATARGKDLAARLATRLGTGLCSSCIGLSIAPDGRTLLMDRLAYGGAAVQTVTCPTRPVMAAIPPRTFDPAPSAADRTGQIRELPPPPASPVRVLERRTRERQTRDITEAGVVVCVGRGFEKREDLDLARSLNDALGGEMGCTRPLSEELHWLPEELCIGLSGAQVKPELYVGIGVSGQIQHVTGIRRAKVICAVNRDEKAPIFDAADFGIVGDLYEVVPQLIQALAQGKKT